MSGGLGDAVGAGITVTIKGEEIVVPPISLDVLGAIENELRAMKPNVLKNAVEASRLIDDPEEKKEFMDRAWREARVTQRVDPYEVIEYITQDPNGISLSMWMLVEKARPGKYSRNDIFDWIQDQMINNKDAVEDLIRRRDIASGLSAESSLPGQAPEQAKRLSRGERRRGKKRRR